MMLLVDRISSGPRAKLTPGSWITRPSLALVVVIGVSTAAAFATPSAVYWEAWHVGKFMRAEDLLWPMEVLASLLLGLRCVSLSGRALPGQDSRSLVLLRSSYPVLRAMTYAGYGVYVLEAVQNGVRLNQLTALIHGNGPITGIRDATPTVSGFTSAAQLGALTVVAASVLAAEGLISKRQSWRDISLVLLMATLRALLRSERVALFEVLLPLLLARTYRLRGLPPVELELARRRARTAFAVLPLAVVVFFGASESIRSFSFNTRHSQQSLIAYTLIRLSGYYATSVNNGVMAEHYYDGRVVGGSPQVTLQGAYALFGSRSREGETFSRPLRTLGNPEFNNPDGLYVPRVELGSAISLVLFMALGASVGLAYRAWLRGHIIGVLAYPILWVGIFELPRYLYWTSTRAAPTLAGAIGLGYLRLAQHGREAKTCA